MFKKTVTVTIDTIDKVKDFVNTSLDFNGSITVVSGRYVVDGKSIMGIFSLDLSHEVEVNIESESSSDVEIIIEKWKSVGI